MTARDYYKLQSLVDAGSTIYVRVAPEPEMRAIISTDTPINIWMEA